MVNKNYSNLIEQQFPDFVREDGPNLVAFVKAYYEWMEESGQVTDATKSLLSYRDIDATLDQYVVYFHDELMANIPQNVLADKRLLAKNIKSFYRARGSEKSYKLLFRILYDDDVEFYYPAEDILRCSDGRWQLDKKLRVNGNDTTYNMEGYEITGGTSGATAVVEQVIKTILDSGFEVFELLLTSIDGTFLDAETVTSTNGYTVTASGANFTESGQYVGTKGWLSWDKYLEDNLYYQEFSYELQTGEFINKFRDIVKKLLHPAGVALFSKVKSVDTINLAPSVFTLYELLLTIESAIAQVSARVAANTIINTSYEIKLALSALDMTGVTDVVSRNFDTIAGVENVRLNVGAIANTNTDQVGGLANTRLNIGVCQLVITDIINGLANTRLNIGVSQNTNVDFLDALWNTDVYVGPTFGDGANTVTARLSANLAAANASSVVTSALGYDVRWWGIPTHAPVNSFGASGNTNLSLTSDAMEAGNVYSTLSSIFTTVEKRWGMPTEAHVDSFGASSNTNLALIGGNMEAANMYSTLTSMFNYGPRRWGMTTELPVYRFGASANANLLLMSRELEAANIYSTLTDGLGFFDRVEEQVDETSMIYWPIVGCTANVITTAYTDIISAYESNTIAGIEYVASGSLSDNSAFVATGTAFSANLSSGDFIMVRDPDDVNPDQGFVVTGLGTAWANSILDVYGLYQGGLTDGEIYKRNVL